MSLPLVATNDDRGTVADAYRALATHATGADTDIATAYFNLGGWLSIADAIERMGKVRLLIGVEPTPADEVHLLAPNGLDPVDLTTLLDRHAEAAARARDMLGFTLSEHANLRRFLDWLQREDVAVARLETEFMHGKMLLVRDDRNAATMVGSANLTTAGMRFNNELVIGSYGGDQPRQVQAWFERAWGSANQSYKQDLINLYSARLLPHDPYTIFLRMLWEHFKDDLAPPIDDVVNLRPELLALAEFQRDGVNRAQHILNRYGGVLIADEVGLGKTYTGAALIDQAHDLGQRVVIVAPRTIKTQVWDEVLVKRRWNRTVECVAYDDLKKDNMGLPASFDVRDIQMLVLDEAHAVRNNNDRRAALLRTLARTSVTPQIVLLSATPVNNRLKDLHHLLELFLPDGVLADQGVLSLDEQFRRADKLDPNDADPGWLFNLLDRVTVRRTRDFLQEHYGRPDGTIEGPGGASWRFPHRNPPERVDYPLDDLGTDLLDSVFAGLSPQDDAEAGRVAFPRLTLAAYLPSRYTLTASKKRVARETNIAALLRSTLLKRFESSSAAFADTTLRMCHTTQAALNAITTSNTILTEVADDALLLGDDSDLSADDLPAAGATTEEVAPSRREQFIADLESDLEVLTKWHAAASATATQPDRDPKLRRLVELLHDISYEAFSGPDATAKNNRKVLVFSANAATVEWLAEHLPAAIRQYAALHLGDTAIHDYLSTRISVVTGQRPNSDRERSDILKGFAPISMDEREATTIEQDGPAFPPAGYDSDLLLATDVLSEGVNLQQAGRIINYDLPWNPMRLVQRAGRIDRLKSAHDEIHSYCFFPAHHLDRMLNLERTLRLKVGKVNISVGAGHILPGDRPVETPQQVFADELHPEEALDGTDAIKDDLAHVADLAAGDFDPFTHARTNSNPEALRQLVAIHSRGPSAKQSSFLSLPSAAGTVFHSTRTDHPLWIFTARILPPGQPSKSQPVQFLSLAGDPNGHHAITTDSWNAINLANPEDPSHPGTYFPTLGDRTPDEMLAAVFPAWNRAVEHIVDEWNNDAQRSPSLGPTKALAAAQNLIADPELVIPAQQRTYLLNVIASDLRHVDRAELLRLATQSRVTANQRADSMLTYATRKRLAGVPRTQHASITADHVRLTTWMHILPAK